MAAGARPHADLHGPFEEKEAGARQGPLLKEGGVARQLPKAPLAQQAAGQRLVEAAQVPTAAQQAQGGLIGRPGPPLGARLEQGRPRRRLAGAGAVQGVVQVGQGGLQEGEDRGRGPTDELPAAQGRHRAGAAA